MVRWVTKIQYRWRCVKCGELMVATSDNSSWCANCNVVLYLDTVHPSERRLKNEGT